ncbi:MAG TPA: histidinol dehydrogenase [Syntrophales bacterium]|nr:histidinol dehydrogenase [Syntrophales bacterium]
MRIIRADGTGFEEAFQKIKNRGWLNEDIWKQTKIIVEDVRSRKDDALFGYTKKFDRWMPTADTIEITFREMKNAAALVKAEELAILKLSAKRVAKFHRKQVARSWLFSDEAGIALGQRITPLERVGIYAPGGLASYPSTVIMAAVPARIAGVPEIFLVTPAKDGQLNPLIITAAKLSGVTRIFKVGGAQAVAALANGTESIPRVDKIVGPGNAYVTAAKMMVYQWCWCGIDMAAGPSEILIIADRGANASYVAADLLAQAEHDEMASAILLTPNEALAAKVAYEVAAQLNGLQRKTIAERAIRDFGAIIVTKNIAEAAAIANQFAPEHLELMVKNPEKLISKIKHAGAVFLGHSTPEALGDYMAGPNHILPTGGTARFSSPLGVYDFVKRSSILSFSKESLQKYGKRAAGFAEMEGLEAHGKSITVRISPKKP